MTQSITKNSKKGFTLVELVVVIAILAILAAIAIPVVNSIINTASRNGALSNAETIELAIKNCQADIAAHNTEVYDGTKTYVDVSGATQTSHNAATAHASISVAEVAGMNAINDAFNQVTYNGVNYDAYWDIDSDCCVFLDAAGNNLETGSAYVAGAGGTQLLVTAAGSNTPDSAVMVDNL